MTNENKKQQGEEFYDMRLGLYEWAENADEYKLVAELIPKSKTTWDLIEILDEINQLLPKDTEFIFDGTISSLRYFVENKQLKLNDIKNPLLKKACFKHLYRPQQTKDIRINLNRWSGQALRCKAVSIGLFIKNKKLLIPEGSPIIEVLENLKEWDFPTFDDDIEKGYVSEEKLTILNSLWLTLIPSQPWNKYKVRTIGEFIIKSVLESFWIPNSYTNLLLQKLQPYVDKVAKKYFPEFHTKDHRACVAVRHAAIIVLYRLINYLPKNVQHHSTLRVDGFLNKFIEYIFTPDFEFQKWFLEYFNVEMEKRIRFIKVLGEEGIFIPISQKLQPFVREKKAIRYVPVFESFRFIPKNEIPLLPVDLIKVFRNQNFSIRDKDEIAKNIVFNIQKLVVLKNEAEQYETPMRESLYTLILSILGPLKWKIRRMETAYHPRLIEDYEAARDFRQTIDVETISSVLKYDASKNPSFFGYIKIMLPLSVHSKIRRKKIELSTISLETLEDEKITDVDMEKYVINPIMKEKLRNIIENLPPKEKEAIKKAYFNTKEKLTEAERKARYRALQKLKLFPELKEFLG